MATTVWKGHLSFGLVSIPIRLFRAARSERVSLRELYRVPVESARRFPREPEPEAETEFPERADREEAVAPVRHVAMPQTAEQPIPREQITKGYEFEKDRFVTLDPAELRALEPKTATQMEISEFVRWEEIDPVFLETSYYVRPDEAGAQAYALLYESMKKTNLVAIARLAMRRREHVVVLRPGKSGVIAHTIFVETEVRSGEEYQADASLVTEKNLELAQMLIGSMTGPFIPGNFRNTYREKLEALIASKVDGKQVAAAAAPAPSRKVEDITEALRKSLASIKKPAKPAASAVRSRSRSQRRGRG